MPDDLTYHDLEIIIRRLKREIKKLEREVIDLKMQTKKRPRRRRKTVFAPSKTITVKFI